MISTIEIRLAREKFKLYQTIRNIFILLAVVILLLTFSGIKFGWFPINFILFIVAVMSAFKQHFHADDYAKLLHLENRVPFISRIPVKKYFMQRANLLPHLSSGMHLLRRLPRIQRIRQAVISKKTFTHHQNVDNKNSAVKKLLRKRSVKDKAPSTQEDLLN